MKSSKARTMNLTNYFKLSRFWLLLKLELYRSRKGILMTFEITFGMLFFIGLLLAIIVEDNMVFYEHQENYAFTLIVGGFVLSSLAFNDLSSTLKGYNYLMLPISTFEKFLSMWLLTSVGWIILFTITYALYTLVANLTGSLLFSFIAFQPFEPLGEFSLNTMKYYFVLHGIFMVGAAHFKGYAFPKTLFALVLFLLICGTLFYFIMGDLVQEGDECLSEYNPLKGSTMYQFWTLLKWLFWWTLAPLCWIITYLGLKDQEV